MTELAPDLERALRHVADTQQIRDCVNRYGRGIDRHDEDVLRTVFHADAVDNHGDMILRREEFIAWGNRWHENVAVAHTHGMTTHIADIDGDEAHALTCVIFCLSRQDGVTLHVGGGRYIDRLHYRDGEWRIVVRRITIDWRFDVDTFSAARLEDLPRGAWDSTDPSVPFFAAA